MTTINPVPHLQEPEGPKDRTAIAWLIIAAAILFVAIAVATSGSDSDDSPTTTVDVEEAREADADRRMALKENAFLQRVGNLGIFYPATGQVLDDERLVAEGNLACSMYHANGDESPVVYQEVFRTSPFFIGGAAFQTITIAALDTICPEFR